MHALSLSHATFLVCIAGLCNHKTFKSIFKRIIKINVQNIIIGVETAADKTISQCSSIMPVPQYH